MIPPGQARWWQWPTILSLDAPLVLVAWQALFARAADVPLRSHHVLLLGACVWLAYSADRWIEAWRLTESTVRTRRHAFFLRHRWSTFAVWVAVLVGSFGLALHNLSAREWHFSLTLLGAALAYLLSHQLVHRRHPWRVPKEICVATILTCGACLYPAANPNASLVALSGPATFFFLLAFANCLLISDWEREVDAVQGQTSLAAHVAARRLAAWLPWLIAAVAIAFSAGNAGDLRRAGLCVALSACALGAVARFAARLGRERARVLADVALLTPLALLFGI